MTSTTGLFYELLSKNPEVALQDSFYFIIRKT